MKLEINQDFEILGFSDSRYEKLTVEIKYKGEPIAQINQDQRVERLDVEVFAELNSAILKVPFRGFVEALILSESFIAE